MSKSSEKYKIDGRYHDLPILGLFRSHYRQMASILVPDPHGFAYFVGMENNWDSLRGVSNEVEWSSSLKEGDKCTWVSVGIDKVEFKNDSFNNVIKAINLELKR